MKKVTKFFVIIAAVVGALAGIATVMGAFAGQPDIVIEFLQQGIDLMGKLNALADRCLEECFQ